jgi:hypothetical protein
MNRHPPLILFTGLQNIRRRPPVSLGLFGKCPGMALPAGKIASRLIDGEIVFRAREMNSRDQPEQPLIRLLECRLASLELTSFNFSQTVSLGISLFNQVAFHVNPSAIKKFYHIESPPCKQGSPVIMSISQWFKDFIGRWGDTETEQWGDRELGG